MSVQEIIRLGHPTLRQTAAPFPLEKIQSAEFKELVDDLRQTLADSGGIGLAAPQINVSVQVAVIEISNPKTRYGEVKTLPFTVFVNPVISVLDPAVAGYWEGCLSVPDMQGIVPRFTHIRYSGVGLDGNPIKREAKGFHARVLQHECDHLDGVLYPMRMTDMSKLEFNAEPGHLAQDIADGVKVWPVLQGLVDAWPGRDRWLDE